MVAAGNNEEFIREAAQRTASASVGLYCIMQIFSLCHLCNMGEHWEISGFWTREGCFFLWGVSWIHNAQLDSFVFIRTSIFFESPVTLLCIMFLPYVLSYGFYRINFQCLLSSESLISVLYVLCGPYSSVIWLFPSQ